ncbi:uncharacterized protein LOC101850860, partial [Aplysia californica]|uniref:Uncharacterized protein LOC101850860 n=1 Tax=Aplysia californica TaxID=6500 RepID=A0ABM1W3K9_APLCA
MESDEDQMAGSISKSSSFSPKVTRPKLPPFAGSGSRSVSPRAKTDPGRGEIKAIMEDIMNLKKTDWKTFSRSRTSPHSKGKSMSTNTSPNSSPRIGSPVADESRSGLTRDRSRSLKLLTDRLKNKNTGAKPPVPEKKPEDEAKDVVIVSRTIELQPSGNKCEQWTPHNASVPSLPPGGSPRRSPDRRSMERTYEQIPEFPEDAEQEAEAEGAKSPLTASSEESFRSAPEVPDDGAREKSPDSDYAGGIREKSPDSEGGCSGKSQDDYDRHHGDKYKPVDDEGIGEGGEASAPVVSTYIYHPIPRNSKFLQLAATKPPKRFPPERRSGITMLATRGRVGGISKSTGDDHRPSDDQPSRQQRLQRRSDSAKSTAPKSSPRFITHPPHMKASHKEAGSVDTNGFAALKSTGDSEDELKQHSQVSLADSQFASELSDEPTYQDVVDCVTLDSNNDVSDRKNGKSTKQKSKSDPSGDRAREMLEFPQSLESPQSHSAPLLSEEELEAMGFHKGMTISEEDARQKSRSETLLSSPSNLDDEGREEHSSGGEDDDGSVECYKGSDTAAQDSSEFVALSPTAGSSKSSSKSIVISAPGTPHGPSPAPSSERPTNLLSVPTSTSGGGSGRKPNIFRSASSASVLQSRKPVGSPLREKDVVRKYSITSDEAMINSKSSVNLVPDFLPIGDTSNAASMPAVWNKDRLHSSDSPEREPGFIKDKRYHIVEELY